MIPGSINLIDNQWLSTLQASEEYCIVVKFARLVRKVGRNLSRGSNSLPLVNRVCCGHIQNVAKLTEQDYNLSQTCICGLTARNKKELDGHISNAHYPQAEP